MKSQHTCTIDGQSVSTVSSSSKGEASSLLLLKAVDQLCIALLGLKAHHAAVTRRKPRCPADTTEDKETVTGDLLRRMDGINNTPLNAGEGIDASQDAGTDVWSPVPLTDPAAGVTDEGRGGDVVVDDGAVAEESPFVPFLSFACGDEENAADGTLSPDGEEAMDNDTNEGKKCPSHDANTDGVQHCLFVSPRCAVRGCCTPSSPSLWQIVATQREDTPLNANTISSASLSPPHLLGKGGYGSVCLGRRVRGITCGVGVGAERPTDELSNKTDTHDVEESVEALVAIKAMHVPSRSDSDLFTVAREAVVLKAVEEKKRQWGDGAARAAAGGFEENKTDAFCFIDYGFCCCNTQQLTLQKINHLNCAEGDVAIAGDSLFPPPLSQANNADCPYRDYFFIILPLIGAARTTKSNASHANTMKKPLDTTPPSPACQPAVTVVAAVCAPPLPHAHAEGSSSSSVPLGTSLASFFKQLTMASPPHHNGRTSPLLLLTFLSQCVGDVLRCLAFLHDDSGNAMGLAFIHRDVKPSNIVLTDRGGHVAARLLALLSSSSSVEDGEEEEESTTRLESGAPLCTLVDYGSAIIACDVAGCSCAVDEKESISRVDGNAADALNGDCFDHNPLFSGVGTIPYMAPELCAAISTGQIVSHRPAKQEGGKKEMDKGGAYSEDVTTACDIWSLGISLVELMAMRGICGEGDMPVGDMADPNAYSISFPLPWTPLELAYPVPMILLRHGRTEAFGPTWKERLQPPRACISTSSAASPPPMPPPSMYGLAYDFISLCLRPSPSERPSAMALLHHPFITSVHTRK